MGSLCCSAGPEEQPIPCGLAGQVLIGHLLFKCAPLAPLRMPIVLLPRATACEPWDSCSSRKPPQPPDAAWLPDVSLIPTFLSLLDFTSQHRPSLDSKVCLTPDLPRMSHVTMQTGPLNASLRSRAAPSTQEPRHELSTEGMKCLWTSFFSPATFPTQEKVPEGQQQQSQLSAHAASLSAS